LLLSYSDRKQDCRRRQLQLVPGGIGQTTAYFADKMQQSRKEDHPKNEHLAKEAAGDIKVEYLAACLAQEA